jgi:multiple sugar transport system permease protein
MDGTTQAAENAASAAGRSSSAAAVQLLRPEAGYGPTWSAITGDPSLWLHDTTTAMWSVVLATVWWTIGFNFLLYLAALQTIPSDIYEAARTDGANWWQQLWGITLPLLGRTTALVLVLQLIASLRIFDQIYLMTGGGPLRSTEVAIQYIYISGFEGFRIGYASALSYVLFVLILLVSIVQFRLFSRKEG